MEQLVVVCEEKKAGWVRSDRRGKRGSNDQVGPFIGGGWVQTSSAVAALREGSALD